MPNTQTATLPTHVGIILDGNRRWAADNGLPSLEGHRRGCDNLKNISIYAFENGVKYLSAYVFSTENWNRTKTEINYLMNLAYKMVTKDFKELHKKGIRVLWLGNPKNLSKKLLKSLRNAEEVSKNNTAGTLALCFNYGGHDEIVNAVKFVVAKGYAAEDISGELIEQNIYHASIPPIDLLIRTSGERRISNFMLWRAAYSELYFVDKNWPEFDKIDLDKALAEYSARTRRFGK